MIGTDDTIHTGDLLDVDLAPAAAMRLAGVAGWRGLTLDAIAAEAGINLAVLAQHYRSRADILDGFERMIDRRMLAGAAAGDTGDKPRDRIFDIIMERFDALLPYRDGIRRVARDLPFDPASGVVLALAMPRSVGWMFAGARISVSGPSAPLKLAALGGLYLSVFRVWLKDEDQDLSKTMAALDRQLDRVTPLFGREFREPQTPPETADGTSKPDIGPSLDEAGLTEAVQIEPQADEADIS